MKKIILLLPLLLLSFFTKSQIVVSSCNAPDSVVANYREDANRLALRIYNQQSSPFKDSVLIPQSPADTMMKALLAVYNATGLPARDTVVSQLHLHSIPDLDLHYIKISAYNNVSWMHQVAITYALPTGNNYVDSLVNKYHFQFFSYTPGSSSLDLLVLKRDSICNATAFAKLFTGVSGVYHATAALQMGDGDDIYASIYADHVALVYSHGWMDCPLGCTLRRNWTFNVYYDCTVEFVGATGNTLIYTDVQSVAGKKLNVYPNPFKNAISVDGLKGSFFYSIRDITGRMVLSGRSDNGRIDKLSTMLPGIYLLQIEKDGQQTTLRVVKQD